jgi:arylsulfatase A-like enzyme
MDARACIPGGAISPTVSLAVARAFLVLFAVGTAGLLAPTARGAAPEKPNLLLLVAEDLGPRIGAFGDRVARTPHLDRLAAERIRFPNTFATAGVCAPSRAALITGVHQIAIGGQHMRASSAPGGGYLAVPPPDVKAFPELLRAAGYYTFVTEKLDYQFSGHATGTGPFSVWDAEDDASLWRGRAEGQPFFGMLNFLETHESGLFRPLGSWPHSWMHLLVQLFRWWRFGLPGGDAPTPLAAVTVPAYYPDVPAVREDIARHYDNIAQMDASVGKVLARLEADGLADTTIVIWTADHGDGLPRAKRELLDAGIRVPLIVRWPASLRPRGITPGSFDERLVSFVDLAPTLLALAGVDRPAYQQGRSFLATGPAPRAYVYAARDRVDEVADRQRAVRDARFAYIRGWHPDLAGGHRLAFRDNLESERELRELYQAGRLDADQRKWFAPVGLERLFDTRSDPEQLHDLLWRPEARRSPRAGAARTRDTARAHGRLERGVRGADAGALPARRRRAGDASARTSRRRRPLYGLVLARRRVARLSDRRRSLAALHEPLRSTEWGSRGGEGRSLRLGRERSGGGRRRVAGSGRAR